MESLQCRFLHGLEQRIFGARDALAESGLVVCDTIPGFIWIVIENVGAEETWLQPCSTLASPAGLGIAAMGGWPTLAFVLLLLAGCGCCCFGSLAVFGTGHV